MGQSVSVGALFPLRLRLWLGSKLFRSLGPKTVRVSWHRVIKGPCDPPEIEAMQHIASHTTIPVPKVYAVHTDKGRYLYIEMAYVKGKTLEAAWPALSTEQKSTITADLKQHLTCLRELKPPLDDMVSSAFQNPAYDCRIGYRFFGPINHDEFHSLARKHLRVEDIEASLGQEAATTHLRRHYRTCFTHADLAPHNILVRHGRIAAIIDWGFAGWYPEYWEFTRAHYNYVSEEWEEYLRLILPSYEVELTAERTLWRMLPEPANRTTSFFSDGTVIRHKGSDPSAAWLDMREGKSADLWTVALASMD